MPRNELGKVRRSQVITQAGPGAIVDFRSTASPVSAVCAGLEQWPPGTIIHEARLERRLNVTELRAPPASIEDARGRVDATLPAVTFPEWRQCPRCEVLQRRWPFEPGEAANYCGECSSAGGSRTYVIPAPFVIACEAGHLDEFPWDRWISHKEGCPRAGRLKLRSEGGPGLAGLRVSCVGCGESESLEGAFNVEALKRFGRCGGRRPWLPGPAAEPSCNVLPRTLQRGASNMYFPVIASALDIPPWSDGLQQRLKRDWDRILHLDELHLRAFLSSLELHRKLGMTEEELFEAVAQRRSRLQDASVEALRIDEYAQLTSDVSSPEDELAEFELRVEQVPDQMRPWISRLARVVRLREVRVLRAFTRIRHPDPEVTGYLPAWAPLSATPQGWLPAVEVRGEGIFVELARDAIEHWSEEHEARAREIDGRWKEEWERRHPDAPLPPPVTPKRLLIHSLAHALIRQLGMDCGYSAASLRERLYTDAECAGLLIYTAAPDSDGTLGGLARQGKIERFLPMLGAAIHAQRWCSSDPLCLSGAHAFSESASGAACHSCLLVSETSCEEFNRLLDRQTLVGGDAAPGFFEGATWV